MEPYKGFRPTGFDSAGIGADRHGIAHFLVLLTRNRDSDLLTESNWDSALATLGGESEDVQVHRFGHWACGWFELILINPDNPAILAIAEDIEGSLSDYPVLDEDDHSKREYDATIANIRDACASWVRDSAPEDWPERVYTWCSDHDPAAIENSDGTGGYPSKDEALRALRALRLIEPKRIKVRSILVHLHAIGMYRRPVYVQLYRSNPAYPF